MAGFGGAVKLTGESDYRKALKEISQDLKELSAETKLVTAQYASNDKSIEALTAKQAALSKQYEAQAQKVKILKDQYSAISSEQDKNKQKHDELLKTYDQESAILAKIAQESGTTSKEYQDQANTVTNLSLEVAKSNKTLEQNETQMSKMRTELLNATTDMTKTENELESLDKEINTTGDDSEKLGKEVKGAADQAQKASKGGFTVLKGILANLAAEGIKNAIAGLKNFASEAAKAAQSAVNDFTNGADEIAKNSAKMGFSSTKSFQEWSYILERSGASMDGMKTSMLKLTKAVESGDKAFKDIGLSADDLKGLSQEDIFAKVVSGLQGIEDQGKRTVIANKLLGKGAVELGDLLNKSASETDQMRQKIHDLGGVMSDEAINNAVDFKDSLTDLKTAVGGIKNSLISEFIPSLKSVSDGLTQVISGGDITGGFQKIASGISDAASILLNQVIPNIIYMIPPLLENGLPVLISGIESVVKSLGEMLPKLLPMVFDAVGTLLKDLAAWLTEDGNVQKMLKGILELTNTLMKSLADLLPIILPAIFSLIGDIVDFLLEPDTFRSIIETTIYIVGQVVAALVKSLPQILSVFTKLFSGIGSLLKDFGSILKSGFSQLGSMIIDKVVSVWNSVKSTLSNAVLAVYNKIVEVKDKIFGFVSDIFGSLKELPSKAVDIGKNLVQGLIDGVKNLAGKAVNAVKDLGKKLLGGVKTVLGIHSPSTVFRDQVGKNIALGIGEGFSDEMSQVTKQMQDEIPTLDVGGVNYGSSNLGSGVLNFQAMVNAFKEALQEVEVVLDDRQVGRFVKKTVETAIYT